MMGSPQASDSNTVFCILCSQAEEEEEEEEEEEGDQKVGEAQEGKGEEEGHAQGDTGIV